MTSICFVALNSYNVLARQPQMRHIGGAEVQQLLAARWLRDQGYRVDFVTLDHGQPDGVVHDGIRVYKAFALTAGVPLVRFVWPRWKDLAGAMRRSNSDIYYQRGAGSETGQVAAWCRLHGRSFVHAVAHEPDCDRRLPKLTARRERVLYRWGLRAADLVVAQTVTQQRLLLENFGRSSTIVRNCALPVHVEGGGHRGGGVLWVGRFHPLKRFEWLLELARRLPDLPFVVVGGANTGSENDRGLTQLLGALPNVRYLGEIPYGDMDRCYQDARVLLCTSEREGFPNVFLEAWRVGVPVVTSVDPDGVVAAKGLGMVGHTLEALERALRDGVADDARLDEMSRRCVAYFREHHSPDVTLPVLERELAGMKCRGRRR